AARWAAAGRYDAVVGRRGKTWSEPTRTDRPRQRVIAWSSPRNYMETRHDATSCLPAEPRTLCSPAMRTITTAALAVFAFGLLGLTRVAGQSAAKTHRLEVTPTTVAYGYYWSDATPALRMASGDIVDVDTLLTNTPAGLEKAGVPQGKIQASLKTIVTE